MSSLVSAGRSFEYTLDSHRTQEASYARYAASMSERIELDVECPNGHNVGVNFTQEEFEERLAAGALEFHCNTCDSTWTPTGAELEEIRRGFAKA